MLASNLYIGPAGWSYPDWGGIVYPAKKPRNFSPLDFIARYFSTVEINSTFYRIPAVTSVNKWINTISRHRQFKFCVKLWQGFTHASNPAAQKDWSEFFSVLRVFADHNGLGALLIQFPWRFKKNDTSLDQLKKIMERFAPFPCAVEFRHGSWQDESTYRLLRDYNAAFVNIDQPVIGDSIEPSDILTSDIGYFRFHGRNYQSWFAEKSDRDARYNYLYSEMELMSWIDSIKKSEGNTGETYIVFNNHFRGQAIINAFQLRYILLQEKPRIPQTLMEAFPEARQFAVAEPDGRTLDLF